MSFVERENVVNAMPLRESDDGRVGQAEIDAGKAVHDLNGRRKVVDVERFELIGPSRNIVDEVASHRR